MIKLSVLIPGVPSRIQEAALLIAKLERLSAGLPVEILYFLDNKKRSIGAKRNALASIASGEYICFVDDDDDVSNGYFKEILKNTGPDIITFDQLANIKVSEETAKISHIQEEINFHISFGINNENEQLHDGIVKRKPFHVCPIKREIAIKCKFGDNNYGEDWDFMEQVLRIAKTEKHIDDILHFYNFDETKTEAK